MIEECCTLSKIAKNNLSGVESVQILYYSDIQTKCLWDLLKVKTSTIWKCVPLNLRLRIRIFIFLNFDF